MVLVSQLDKREPMLRERERERGREVEEKGDITSSRLDKLEYIIVCWKWSWQVLLAEGNTLGTPPGAERPSKKH